MSCAVGHFAQYLFRYIVTHCAKHVSVNTNTCTQLSIIAIYTWGYHFHVPLVYKAVVNSCENMDEPVNEVFSLTSKTLYF